MNTLRFLVILLALVVAATASAQTVYRWVDDEGEVHYGHAVPPEHAARGYERLGPDGIVRERIEPALTPEEIAERREQMRREAERASRERDQETRDRMLLATYRSEDDLAQGLERQLVSIQSQRTSIHTAIQAVDRRFENLVGRAAGHTRYGDNVPPALESSIDETRSELQRLHNDLAGLDQREAAILHQHEEKLERFRQLTGESG